MSLPEPAAMLASRQWIEVAGLALVVCVGLGGTLTILPLFIVPIVDATHWPLSKVELFALTFMLGMNLALPGVGYLIDRYGERRMIVAGGMAVALGYAAAAIAPNAGEAVAAMALAGVGVGACTALPAMTIIAKRMSARRNLATGIVIGASSLGGAIFAPLLTQIISAHGWRVGFNAIGAMVLVVCIAVPTLTLEKDAVTPGPDSNRADGAPTGDGLYVGEALHSPWFWLVLVASALGSYGTMGVMFAAAPQFSRNGFSAEEVGWIYAMWNGASIGGYLLTGWLSDRLGPRRVLPVGIVIFAVACALPPFCNGSVFGRTMVFAFVVVWGATMGLPSQLSPMVLFEGVGGRKFGLLFGIVSLVTGLTMSAAPSITEMVQVASGSYSFGFVTAGAVTLSALVPALVLLRLPLFHGRRP
jgi:MFS family permease